LRGMLGDDARIESTDRRVEAYGTEAGHPQVAAHEVVATGEKGVRHEWHCRLPALELGQ